MQNFEGVPISAENPKNQGLPNAPELKNIDIEASGTSDSSEAKIGDKEELNGGEGFTWKDVCVTCFVHSPKEWMQIFVTLFLVCFFLFFFILGLEILGDGAQVLTGCAAGGMFSEDMNPIAGLMVGVLTTVCLQSSSTTTSIIVSLVGAGALQVEQAIYMVMGANIGTSVTNTLVAMGQLGDGDQLERAFAGATVHDMFNWLTVLILLPVEVVTGYLAVLTAAMVKNVQTSDGDTNDSFVKKYIEPIGLKLIIVNKKVITHVSQGGKCEDFYPLTCDDGVVSYKTCTPGLIACSKKGWCPALFDPNATQANDTLSGFVAFMVGIIILFVCLGGLVAVLQKALAGVSKGIIRKATNLNGYVAIVIGALLTMAVQSSSITTSTLTPLVGLDILQLEQMLPLTLGANIGTCMTSLMAAMVTEGTESLQVALAHLFFNITGIIIWYPVPFMRAVPLYLARQLGVATRCWRGFPIVYVLVSFLLFPGICLGLSSFFTIGTVGGIVAGSILTALLLASVAGFTFWWVYRGGKSIVWTYFMNRQCRTDARATLAYDMHWCKRMLKDLKEHTSCTEVKIPAVARSNAEALLDIHTDMPFAEKTIQELLKFCGFPESVAREGSNSPPASRKETEKELMPASGLEVDVSGYRTYQITVATVNTVVIGSIFVGVGVLFAKGNVASTALAGLITCCVGIYIFCKIGELLFSDGQARGLETYKEKMLREKVCGIYGADIVEIKATIDALVAFTGMPHIEAEEKVEKADAPNLFMASLRSSQLASLRASQVTSISV